MWQPSTLMSVIRPFLQLPPWGTRSEGRRLGASSLKIKWPRIHPLSLHHRTSSKSNLVYLGQNFWVAILKLLSPVWLFPPKAPVPGYSLKILQHINSYMFHELQSLFEIHPPQNRGMHSQHAIPLNDESATFKALCLSLGREDGRCFPGKNRNQEIGEDAWLASKFKCYWCSSCDLHCSKWQKTT